MSSFQIQVSNFMSAMAGAIASSALATQQHESEDFSPDSANDIGCESHQLRAAQDPPSLEYLRIWLPSVETLVKNLDLAPDQQKLKLNSVRNFGDFVAQLESPSASAFESYQLHQTRIGLSERSLTYADFRHAVDHHVDYASSTWQNN